MATTPNKPNTPPAIKSTVVPSPTATATKPYTSPVRSKGIGAPGVPRGNQTFLFDRKNYIWMAGGLACILLGFILMSGGKSPDPHQFNYAEIYSFRRITLAPMLILIGFGIEVYAIMRKHGDAALHGDALNSQAETSQSL